MPAKENANAARGIAVGVIIVDLCFIPSAASALLRAGGSFAMFFPLYYVAALVGTLCGLGSLVLLRDCRAHFRKAAKQAAANQTGTEP